MSENKVPPIAAAVLTQEQIDAINGGSCTVADLVGVSSQLRVAYDNLVDFTSYVIERVAAK
jgi:hypothetical protein